MRVLSIHPVASDHLNLIRGLAAFAVVAGHLRALFFQRPDQASQVDLFKQVVYFFMGLGHQAVIVFFVLSGFFVSGSAFRTMGRWSWPRYFGERLIRLYLVFLPALFLTAIADQISVRMPLGNRYFFHVIPSFKPDVIVHAMSPQVFLGNVLFLQTVLVPPFGSNNPLWSLSYEFWYYMLFPLFFVPVFNPRSPRRWLSLCIALVLATILPRDMMMLFVVWLAGVGLHFLPAPAFRAHALFSVRAFSFATFTLVLVVTRLGRLPGLPGDLSLGCSFGAWMYCLLLQRNGAAAVPAPESHRLSRYSRMAALLAGCSYSLYAIHFPLLMLARTLIVSAPWPLTAPYLGTGMALALAIVLVARLFSSVTEANTQRVRRIVCNRAGLSLTAKSPAPVTAIS